MRRGARRGFTMVEMLLAVGISVVVAAELVMVFAGIFRLQKDRMWNAEFADRLRVARERLLFNAAPVGGNGRYSGLLCATNIIWTEATGQVQAHFFRQTSNGQVGFDETGRDLSSRVVVRGLDDGEREVVTDALSVTNGLVFVSVMGVVGGSNRVERIAVPQFEADADEREQLWGRFISVSPGDIVWREQP